MGVAKLLALFGALAVFAGASEDVGKLKLENITKLRDASGDGIIEFTPAEY